MIKLSESECLWRLELKVVTDEAAKMTVSVRANKISSQEGLQGLKWGLGPSIEANHALLRDHVDETGLEHRNPV